MCSTPSRANASVPSAAPRPVSLVRRLKREDGGPSLSLAMGGKLANRAMHPTLGGGDTSAFARGKPKD